MGSRRRRLLNQSTVRTLHIFARKRFGSNRAACLKDNYNKRFEAVARLLRIPGDLQQAFPVASPIPTLSDDAGFQGNPGSNR